MTPSSTSTGYALMDDAELDLSRHLQTAFVPSMFRGWPGVRVAARRIECAGFSGDFHGVIRGRGDCDGLVLGTVAGPSIFAALAKAVLSRAIRRVGLGSTPPPSLLDHLNELLEHINCNLREQRVTCAVFHGLFDRAHNTLTCTCAGEIHPVVWDRDGQTQFMESAGPPLGDITKAERISVSLDMASIKRLLLFSGGLPMARCEGGGTFGLDRARGLAMRDVHLPVEDHAEAAIRAVRNARATTTDTDRDITILIAEVSEKLISCKTRPIEAGFLGGFRAAGPVPDPSVFLG